MRGVGPNDFPTNSPQEMPLPPYDKIAKTCAVKYAKLCGEKKSLTFFKKGQGFFKKGKVFFEKG